MGSLIILPKGSETNTNLFQKLVYILFLGSGSRVHLSFKCVESTTSLRLGFFNRPSFSYFGCPDIVSVSVLTVDRSECRQRDPWTCGCPSLETSPQGFLPSRVSVVPDPCFLGPESCR